MNFYLDKKINIYNTYSFKMFVIFSAISLVSLFIITYLIISQVSELMVNQEMKMNDQIVIKTTEYMDKKIASATKTIQDIYFLDSEMQEIIDQMLNEEWDDTKILQNMDYKQRFNNFFISELYNDSDILDIMLVSNNGMKSYVFSKNWSTVTLEDNQFVYSWAKEISDNYESLTLIPSYTPLHTKSYSDRIYSMATSLYTTNGNDNSLGTVIINFKTDKVEGAYESYSDDIKGDIVVFDNLGRTIYDSSGKYYDEEYPFFDSIINDQDNFNDLDGFVSVGNTEGKDVFVFSIISEEKMFKGINSLKLKVNLVLLIVIILLLIAYYTTSRFMVKRINLIMAAIGEVQQGNLEVRIPIGNNQKDELHSIALMFNSMCEELDEYIRRTYLFELKLKETELIALQSQVNPHFIYNTLEIIRVKALINNNHDVGNMINLLSNLFRRSLRNKNIVITIKEELDYCRDYLELNQIRFLDRMTVKYNIDPSINQYGTLKAILQPLIENIIVHGVDGSSEMVDIFLEGYLRGDNIVIDIVDTGKGINEKKLKELREKLSDSVAGINHQHIGIKNVNDRLKIVFGNQYGLSIDSVEHKMTIISITFPAMHVNDMKELTNII